MHIVLRTATHEDYEAMCILFAQLDRVHYQAFHEFFAEILADEDAALQAQNAYANDRALVGNA